MKPLYSLSLLALLGTACQQQAAQQATATPATTSTAQTVAETKAVANTITNPPKPELTPETREFLRQHDLSSLLQLDDDYSVPMNGFYGADHYRIEFVFTRVRRDEQNPGVFYIEGKNRYKQAVTPFNARVTLHHVTDQAGANNEQAQRDGEMTAYSALGTFELQESTASNGAGTINGKVALDFGMSPEREVVAYCQSEKAASRYGGVLFEGTWTSNRTGQSKPVVWVTNIFDFGPAVLENFAIGERDRSFNPKYAKLGWDTYWENDEWWAEPGASATAQLTATDTL